MSDSRDASLSGVSGTDASGGSGAASDGHGSGSSLADAVAAALANVSTPPPGSGARETSEREPDTVRMPVVGDVGGSAAAGEPATAAASDGEAAGDEREPAKAGGDERPGEPAAPGGGEPVEQTGSEPAASVVASVSVTVAGASGGEGSPSGDDSSAGGGDPAPSGSGDSEGPTSSDDEPASPRGEPTVRVGGAKVEHLTPESAKEAPEGLVIQYYGRTDVGLVREHNEDNFLVADLSQERRGLGDEPAIIKTTLGDRGLVLAVCDGMGGAAAGEVASQMAVDTIYEVLQAGSPPKDRDQFARRLVRAIEEAGSRIFAAAKMDRSRRGMGTTATVAALVDSTLFVGQVGDSRAYVLRGDQLALITKDQSLVNQLIEAGQLTEEEAEAFEHSNIILQALGTTEEVTVDLTFLELRQGDRLLMCSDGLSGLVHADMIREVLKGSRDLSEAAQQLIAMANAGGGHDNITVICAEFDGTALRAPTPEAKVAYQQYPLPPEDESDPDPLPVRPTSIKAGGPKPGADVKLEGVRAPRDGDEAGPSSRLWVIGLVLLFVLVCIGVAIVLLDTGEQTSAAETPTSVTIESRRSRTSVVRPPREHGTVEVRTDEEGDLYVDGERRPGSARTTLSLTPGPHRLEIRRGDARVAEATVSVEAGARLDVDLSMPSGASDLIAAEPVPSGTAVGGASPMLDQRPVRSAAPGRTEPSAPPAEASAESGAVL